jgi:hypothetical protein
MVNYNLGKIYKIIDNTTDNIYIGSTCEPTLARRLAGHVATYKGYLQGKTTYLTSFQILKNDNYNIILIEQCVCNNRDELLAKERFHIENTKCVNKVIPRRSNKEYYNDNIEKIKEYYNDNIEKIKEYSKKYIKENKEKVNKKTKQYHVENKEKISKKRNKKYNCVCGGKYTNCNKTHHLITSKHQAWLQKQNSDSESSSDSETSSSDSESSSSSGDSSDDE